MSDTENDSDNEYVFPRKRKNMGKENYKKRKRGETYMGSKLVDGQKVKCLRAERKIGKKLCLKK